MSAAPGSPRYRQLVARLVLVALGISLPLAAVELGLRTFAKKKPRMPPSSVFCGDCPQIFDLNPSRPDVSRQKLRDREFTQVPEEGMLRVLVVGDSLPYGPHVAPTSAFPKVLEKSLGGRDAHVEVINSGALAYTPYNERQLYAHRLRDLRSQLVVISFCMNDVVDPSLHWASLVAGNGGLDHLPADAIPNEAYHRDHALPRLRQVQRERGSRLARLLSRSELYKQALAPLLAPGMPDTHVESGGKRFPAFLSGEDTIGMKVLMDYDSPEWVWLRSQYDRMLADIREDGAAVAIVINPLQYQLAEGYPLFPQLLFERFCAERKLRCLDLLPALRQRGGERLFFGKHEGAVDVWHYTSEGHQVVGEAIAEFLRREGLVPR